METTQQKLKKFSQIVYVLATIGKIICIVGITACIICTVIFATPEVRNTLPETTITVETANGGSVRNLADMLSMMAFSLTATIFSLVVCSKLQKLFANMRDQETPFTMENAEIFKSIAIIMLVGAVVPTVVAVIVGYGAVAIDRSLSFNVGYDMNFSIMSVLICFVMSVVFKYGCELQTQVDETL